MAVGRNLALWALTLQAFAGCAASERKVASAAPVEVIWLADLHAGDVLTYEVRSEEGQILRARYRVARLVRRGKGVAALMEPQGESAFGLHLSSYWLAGDDRALYRLERGPELADPEFVPLDASGGVLSEVTHGARWRVPGAWPDMGGTGSDEGWEVEELEMLVDGPVRGDRCAQIRQRASTPPARLTVCGSVGLVTMVRGAEGSLGERWRLVAIGDRNPIADGPSFEP